MTSFIFLTFVLNTGILIDGFRQQSQGALDIKRSESDVNEAADMNTKAFADVRSQSGICHGKSVPSSCCCAPAANEGQCKGDGFYFYPGVRPFDKGAFATRTCSAHGLCCKTASAGRCPAKGIVVNVKDGENKEKRSKVYVKVLYGRSRTEHATSPTTGAWNQKFRFAQVGPIAVEVKYKRTLGASSYGTIDVKMPTFTSTFWEAAVQDVSVDIPKFGQLNLQISTTLAQGVDDDFDTTLCSATTSALLQQSIAQGGPEQSLDDFLAELDKAAPTENKLSQDTPAFLNVLAHKPNQQRSDKFMTRDYTLIIDRSGSMSHAERVHVPMKTAEKLHKSAGHHELSRWDQVDGALRYLVPYVVAEDPDGIGVYFFDSKWDEAPNVCDDSQVHNLFRRNRPGGLTYLGDVLREAMEPDTVGRAETIFILTDGQASDPDQVTRSIIEYTKKMCKPEMLSISFIQVGLNGPAQDYLNSLDDDLERQGAKFDIVDAMTKDEMEGKSFLDVVELSVHD